MKKSESLEIRIPHATKQAFMARCQAEGRSASEALRGFIEAHLEEAEALRRSRRRWRLAAGALVAAGMIAGAAPTLAGVAPLSGWASSAGSCRTASPR